MYARQRPGGVAWDAVPLTVRGLNKAAGNPPFTQYYANTKLIPLIAQIITHDYLIITHKFLFYSSLNRGSTPPSIFMRNR